MVLPRLQKRTFIQGKVWNFQGFVVNLPPEATQTEYDYEETADNTHDTLPGGGGDGTDHRERSGDRPPVGTRTVAGEHHR